jgi:predicted neutral ceramidase superfamily lipid hydrolase
MIYVYTNNYLHATTKCIQFINIPFFLFLVLYAKQQQQIHHFIYVVNMLGLGLDTLLSQFQLNPNNQAPLHSLQSTMH